MPIWFSTWKSSVDGDNGQVDISVPIPVAILHLHSLHFPRIICAYVDKFKNAWFS